MQCGHRRGPAQLVCRARRTGHGGGGDQILLDQLAGGDLRAHHDGGYNDREYAGRTWSANRVSTARERRVTCTVHARATESQSNTETRTENFPFKDPFVAALVFTDAGVIFLPFVIFVWTVPLSAITP